MRSKIYKRTKRLEELQIKLEGKKKISVPEEREMQKLLHKIFQELKKSVYTRNIARKNIIVVV